MTNTNLDHVTPREAYETHIQDADGDLSPNSVQQKEYQLKHFITFLDEQTDVEYLSEVTGRHLIQYKNHRQNTVNKVTLKTNLSTLKVFLRFCLKLDAVNPSLVEKVPKIGLKNGENVRKNYLSRDAAQEILDYFGRYHYASLPHVLFLLHWQSGARMGALHSIDLADIDYEDNQITIEHRPDSGTRLKNEGDGERIITFPEKTMEIVGEYVEHHRPPVTDDYDREPLFATKHGRMDKMSMNRHSYRLTTPCERGAECPEGRNPFDCEYTGSMSRLIKCEYNVRPHDVRRGAITHQLRSDVPEVAVRDRFDVSAKTIDRHYDKRSEEEKADSRRDYFNFD